MVVIQKCLIHLNFKDCFFVCFFVCLFVLYLNLNQKKMYAFCKLCLWQLAEIKCLIIIFNNLFSSNKFKKMYGFNFRRCYIIPFLTKNANI